MFVTQWTAEEQAARQRQHRAIADRRRVAEFDPLGRGVLLMTLEHTERGYELDGDLRLFAPRDPFDPAEGPTIPITAVGDDDAVEQAASLIREQWMELYRRMAARQADTPAEEAALQG